MTSFFRFVNEVHSNMTSFFRFVNEVHSNITSFFHFVNKRAIYRLSIISLVHAPVHVTDFPVVNVHVDEFEAQVVCDIVRKRKYK